MANNDLLCDSCLQIRSFTYKLFFPEMHRLDTYIETSRKTTQIFCLHSHAFSFVMNKLFILAGTEDLLLITQFRENNAFFSFLLICDSVGEGLNYAKNPGT